MTIAGPIAADDPHHAPIYLETEQVDGGIGIRVVGDADTAVEATYTLEVSSGGAGSNRSVQSGRARLEPNRQVTLINLRLGHVDRSDWSAKLRVEPVGAPSYTEVVGADR